MARIIAAGGVAALLTVTGATPGTAQLREVGGPRVQLGIGGVLARPVGEFQRFVDWGGGVDLYGVVHFDPDRRFGLRLDGSLLIYGHERYSTPLSQRIPRVVVDVSTDNLIFQMGIGPQITFGRDRMRPYLFGTLGFSYFATVSSIEGTAGGEGPSSTNFDDVTPALTGGGGILYRVSNGRHPVSLDVSVRKAWNGEAQYLRRGGIVDHPDGTYTVFPIRSDANLLGFRMGVAVGL